MRFATRNRVTAAAVILTHVSACSYLFERPQILAPDARVDCPITPPIIDTTLFGAAVLALAAQRVAVIPEHNDVFFPSLGEVAALLGALATIPVTGSSAIYGFTRYRSCTAEARRRDNSLVAEELATDAIGAAERGDCGKALNDYSQLKSVGPGAASAMILSSTSLRQCMDAHDAAISSAVVASARQAQSHRGGFRGKTNAPDDACARSRASRFRALNDITDRAQRAAALAGLPSCLLPSTVASSSDRFWVITKAAATAALAADCATAEARAAEAKALDDAQYTAYVATNIDIAACQQNSINACRQRRAEQQRKAMSIVDAQERGRALMNLPSCDGGVRPQ